MTIDKKKLEIAMCRACMNSKETAAAAKIPRATFNNAVTGRSVRPATLGKIAAALGIDPEELIKED